MVPISHFLFLMFRGIASFFGRIIGHSSHEQSNSQASSEGSSGFVCKLVIGRKCF